MKSNKALAAVISLSFLVLASCSKIKDTDNLYTADPNAKQHNEDISNTRNESDNLNAEINNVLRDLPGFGKTELTEAVSICGASIDSSHQYDPVPKLIINFDGITACGNPARKRSGQVVVELIQGSSWSVAGAKLKANSHRL
jgi:hypothetical protein